MNPNKYLEFEYNGESYVVPKEWLDEHDKQIRAEVIDEILNEVNSYIADMKKYFSETQDETFLCAISETQKVRNVIRNMLKEQK